MLTLCTLINIAPSDGFTLHALTQIILKCHKYESVQEIVKMFIKLRSNSAADVQDYVLSPIAKHQLKLSLLCSMYRPDTVSFQHHLSFLELKQEQLPQPSIFQHVLHQDMDLAFMRSLNHFESTQGQQTMFKKTLKQRL